VAVGKTSDGNISNTIGILTSSDGISWDNRTYNTSSGLYHVTYGNSTFMTVGESGTILTSSDGITWTARTSGTSNTLNKITYKE